MPKFWHWLVIIVLYFIVPVLEIRLVTILLTVGFGLQKTWELPEWSTYLFLWCIFSLGFILAPYWQVFSWWPLKYSLLLILVGLVSIWAMITAKKITWKGGNFDIWHIGLLTFLIYLTHFGLVAADIPWQGDEEYHVNRLLDIFSYFAFYGQDWHFYLLRNPFLGILLTEALVISSILFFKKIRLFQKISRAKNYWIVVATLVFPTLATTIFPSTVFSDQTGIFKLADIIRYPYLQRWWQFVLVWPFPVKIQLYRALPFLSLLLIAWILYFWFAKKLPHKLLAVGYAYAFTTIPLMTFYGSLLYLELPIVFIMLICLFQIKNIISQPYSILTKQPVWLCLVILPFLKETTIMFLLLVVGVRTIFQQFVLSKNLRPKRFLLSEFLFAVSILSPAILYLLFRKYFSGFRPYGWQLVNIVTLTNYLVLGKALFLQFGFLMIFGAIGVVYLVKKDPFGLKLQLLFLVGSIIFFLGDEWEFVGYSRWNLFLVPGIFYFVYRFVISQKKPAQILLLLILLISNSYFSPIWRNRLRKPNWGSPNTGKLEYIFPYDETLGWLSQENKTKQMLSTGYFDDVAYFGFDFYFRKYQWFPLLTQIPLADTPYTAYEEPVLFEQLLEHMQTQNLDIDTIVYQSIYNIKLDQNKRYGTKYTVIKKFSNGLHTIYVLRS